MGQAARSEGDGGSVKAVLVRVRGRVQRIGYRRYVLDVAQELGLTGYVKNIPDGSVEIKAQGDGAKISQFLEKIKAPPIGAVREVEVEEAAPEQGMGGFRMVCGDVVEELQEGFGAMQTIFMQYWGEFREFRQEFREFKEGSLKISREILETSKQTLEISKQTLEISRQTLEISKQTLSEVRALREDLRTMLDERISRMERDIAEIKARLGLA